MKIQYNNPADLPVLMLTALSDAATADAAEAVFNAYATHGIFVEHRERAYMWLNADDGLFEAIGNA